jgi:hypothetical protein
MKAEAYCASQLQFLESERFLSVGEQRPEGRYPDLVSQFGSCYRIREVKFKLEARLVRKALSQLEAGLRAVEGEVDRLELVIALQGRRLKDPEKVFLGSPLSDRRYELLLDGTACRIANHPVSVLLL